MFTENYYSWRRLVTTATTSHKSYFPSPSTSVVFYKLNGTEFGNSSSEYVTMNHANAYYSSPFYFMAYGKVTDYLSTVAATLTSVGEGGVIFGKGRTPATRRDYYLEDQIVSGINIENQQRVSYVEEAGGVFRYFASYVVTNTSEEDIAIGEIGIVTWCGKWGSSSNDTKGNYTLMERTVLETPITLAPGESKIVNYVISFTETQI